MRPIIHKIRKHRENFRPAYRYAVRSRIFLLFCVHVLITFSALGLYLGSLIFYGSKSFSHVVPIVLGFELFLLLGSIQVIAEGIKRRHELHNPSRPKVSLRLAELIYSREKVQSIRTLFEHNGSMSSLAKDLVEQWEWNQEIKRRAHDPALTIAAQFYRPPSSGNIATLAAGAIAIFAAIVIAVLDGDSFFEALPSLWNNSKHYISWLSAIVILPIAAAVYPIAIFWTFCRSIVSTLLENLDDDRLSRRSFYDFIKELLEIDERQEKRLLMRTTGRVYWSFRVLTANIHDIPRIIRNARRSTRLSKRRKQNYDRRDAKRCRGSSDK